MNHKRQLKLGFGAASLLAAASLMAAACGDTAGTNEPESSEPARPAIVTRADLERAYADLDARLNANPADAKFQEELAYVSRAADRINGLVARVETETGHTVDFKSPSDGVVVVSEKSLHGQNRVLREGAIKPGGLAAFYQSLRSGEVVPQALIDRQARSESLRARPDRASSRAGAGHGWWRRSARDRAEARELRLHTLFERPRSLPARRPERPSYVLPLQLVKWRILSELGRAIRPRCQPILGGAEQRQRHDQRSVEGQRRGRRRRYPDWP